MHRTSWKRWPRATGSSFVLSITFTATWKTEVRTDQNNSSAGNVSSCWSTCTETVRLYYLHLEVLSRASTDVLMSTKNRITLSEIFSLISAPSHPSLVCLFLRTRVTSLKVFLNFFFKVKKSSNCQQMIELAYTDLDEHTFSPVNTWRASLTTAKCPRPNVLSRSYSPAIFPSWWRFSPAMAVGGWGGRSCLLSPAGLRLSVLHLLLIRLNVREVGGGGVWANSGLTVDLLVVDLIASYSTGCGKYFGFWVLHSVQSHFAMIWGWERGKQ